MLTKNEKDYYARLDPALLAWDGGDEGPMRKLAADYGLSTFSMSPEVIAVAMQKAITARVALPMEVRQRAHDRLVAAGHRSFL